MAVSDRAQAADPAVLSVVPPPTANARAGRASEPTSRPAFRPGATTVVPVLVAAPDEPGAYLLELDLVHEFVRWFEQPARTEASVGGREAGVEPAALGLLPDGRPGSEGCRGAAPASRGRGRDRRGGRLQAW